MQYQCQQCKGAYFPKREGEPCPWCQSAAAEKRATEAEVLLLVYRGTLRFASGAIEHNTKWCAENSELHKHCLEAQALINTALLSHNPHAQAVAEVLEKAQAWADGCDEPEDTEALRAAIAALNKEPQ